MSEHTQSVLRFALVGVGGFAGALSRYAVDLIAPSLLATLAVNVAGSFALGLLFYTQRQGDILTAHTMLVAATGFVSSFTTYSTFVVDAVTATPIIAGAYVLASYLLGFGAALVGKWASSRLGAQPASPERGVG